MHTFPLHLFFTYILHMFQIHAFDSWVLYFFSFSSTFFFHSHAFHSHIFFTYFTCFKYTRSITRSFAFFSHVAFSHARSPIALLFHIHTSHVSKTRVRFPGLTCFFYFIIYSCVFIYAPTFFTPLFIY